MKRLTIPSLILILGLAACGGSAARSDYEANLAKWTDQDIPHYRYQLAISCFCPFGAQMPLTIEVKDGEAVSITTADGSDRGPNGESYRQVDTIDKLFETLAHAQANADEVKVTYDPTYGYPASIMIDNIANAVDDEISYGVSGFEILPQAIP